MTVPISFTGKHVTQYAVPPRDTRLGRPGRTAAIQRLQSCWSSHRLWEADQQMVNPEVNISKKIHW